MTGKFGYFTDVSFIILSSMLVFLSGCKKEEAKEPSRSELLTSTSWSMTINAGIPVADEEDCVCGFRPDRSIMGCNFVQNYSQWSLKDNDEILVLDWDEYEIKKLTRSELEIKYNTFTGYSYSFKAVSSVKPVTIGVTDLTNNSAILHGTIRTNTSSAIVSFEYGTSISYGQMVAAKSSQIPPFTITAINASLSGLNPETVYHYRVKVVADSETFYGQDLTFRTFNSLTVNDIDENVYYTTTIGSQIWMTKNLGTTKYNDGNSIPNVIDNATWISLTTPGYCWNDNDAATFKNTYGALYNWYAINTTSNGNRNVCPTGYHVPNVTEWVTLAQFLGQDAGIKLCVDGTNASGFSANGGGFRKDIDGLFGSVTGPSYFWTTTEESTNNAFVCFINCSIETFYLDKQMGCSVRCIKD